MHETWRSGSGEEFVRAMNICEERLLQALDAGHYSLAIACARFLTVILELALEHQDNTTNALRSPSSSSLRLLVHRSFESNKVSSEAVSDLQVIASRLSKRIEESHLGQLARYILRLQARLLLLLDDEACTTSFSNNFERMVTSQSDAAVQLFNPYLLEISSGCRDTSDWFPSTALQALGASIDRPRLYVSIVELLLRTPGIHFSERHELSERIINYLEDFGAWDQGKQTYTNNGWYLYIIASEAGCNGWHEIMYHVLESLGKMVCKDETYECVYGFEVLKNFFLV
ncbi:hypothetical protein BDB00DRAFT_754134 [Zychaea mexicana]|uniref:uncharacterized protein n=1 Tax=Zychaea mexicana TaxID=64656 RepID=UPI0022FEA5E3|nr:uncharacterized protein BDB00DRAFT_754134 [Zychaea mexicana]KAI9499048.1 hypothetical protein BDB00DRAFT_754134 [Zychaea mexicana]